MCVKILWQIELGVNWGINLSLIGWIGPRSTLCLARAQMLTALSSKQASCLGPDHGPCAFWKTVQWSRICRYDINKGQYVGSFLRLGTLHDCFACSCTFMVSPSMTWNLNLHAGHCRYRLEGIFSPPAPYDGPGKIYPCPIFLDNRGTGQWKWIEEVPRRTSLVPLCVPLFCTLFNRGGNRSAFRLPGAGGEHFHCTVEPSSGHIRCRIQRYRSYWWLYGPGRFLGGPGTCTRNSRCCMMLSP